MDVLIIVLFVIQVICLVPFSYSVYKVFRSDDFDTIYKWHRLMLFFLIPIVAVGAINFFLTYN